MHTTLHSSKSQQWLKIKGKVSSYILKACLMSQGPKEETPSNGSSFSNSLTTTKALAHSGWRRVLFICSGFRVILQLLHSSPLCTWPAVPHHLAIRPSSSLVCFLKPSPWSNSAPVDFHASLPYSNPGSKHSIITLFSILKITETPNASKSEEQNTPATLQKTSNTS